MVHEGLVLRLVFLRDLSSELLHRLVAFLHGSHDGCEHLRVDFVGQAEDAVDCVGEESAVGVFLDHFEHDVVVLLDHLSRLVSRRLPVG